MYTESILSTEICTYSLFICSHVGDEKNINTPKGAGLSSMSEEQELISRRGQTKGVMYALNHAHT